MGLCARLFLSKVSNYSFKVLERIRFQCHNIQNTCICFPFPSINLHVYIKGTVDKSDFSDWCLNDKKKHLESMEHHIFMW